METGAAVTKVKAGDKVVLSWIKGNGIEAGGAIYEWEGRKVNAGGVTTFQRHALVSENRLTLVPPGMPMELAVLLGCAAPTGMGAIFNVLKVQAGDSVAVYGSGGIGLNSILAAAFAGAIADHRRRPEPDAQGVGKNIRRHACDRSERGRSDRGDQGDRPAGCRCRGRGHRPARRHGPGRELDAAAGRSRRRRRQRGLRQDHQHQSRSLQFRPQPARDLGRRQFSGSRLRPLRQVAQLQPLSTVRDLLSKPYRLEEADQALGDLAAGRVGRPLIDMSLR